LLTRRTCPRVRRITDTQTLTAATRNYTSSPLTFVTRFSIGFSSASFLYAYVMPTDTAVYVAFRGTDLTGVINTIPSANSAVRARCRAAALPPAGRVLPPLRTRGPHSSGSAHAHARAAPLCTSCPCAQASLAVDADTQWAPLAEVTGASQPQVHAGFYHSLVQPNIDSFNNDAFKNANSAYTDIKAAIAAALTAAGNKDLPIVLTGHSLGGAQASLAAFLLKLDGFTNVSLYTFGCPQVRLARQPGCRKLLRPARRPAAAGADPHARRLLACRSATAHGARPLTRPWLARTSAGSTAG
jgi:hypothetical protein